MGPNFDIRVSIHLNPENIFMALFIDLRSCMFMPLNSAMLSCSNKVTLTSSHTHTGPEVIFMFISPEGEFYTNGHAQRAKIIFCP